MKRLLSFLLLIYSATLHPFSPLPEEEFNFLMEHSHQMSLPKDSPFSLFLDEIFYQGAQALKSVDSMKRYGFIPCNKSLQTWSQTISVFEHPLFPEFVVKCYLSNANHHPYKEYFGNYIKRIRNARFIASYFKKHSIKKILVPQKWLYFLPDSSNTFSLSNVRPTILIAEKIDIVTGSHVNGLNLKLYKAIDYDMLSTLITFLYDMNGCEELMQNIPFTTTKKLAVIDTEHLGLTPHHFFKYVIPALSKEKKQFALSLWKKLSQRERYVYTHHFLKK
jgi:hypothetical protein